MSGQANREWRKRADRGGSEAAFQARVAAAKGRVSLEALVGKAVKLRRAGREWVGLCPFHQEATPSFTVAPDKGFYHCFGCGAHGDAIRWLMDFENLSFAAALESLEGPSGAGRDASASLGSPRTSSGGGSALPPAARGRDQRSDDTFVDSLTAAQAVWRTSAPAHGTLVETYLRHRGVDPRASGILNVLRYHPRCPVSLWRRWETVNGAIETCEAMVVPIGQVVGGGDTPRRFALQGVEVVFLAADGGGKRKFAPLRSGKVPPSRKIWGDAARGGCPVPPPGCDAEDLAWLNAPAPLVVAEGLESTLSLVDRVRTMFGVRGGFATLSLNNLQGGCALTQQGAIQLFAPTADMERPPFLIERPGAVVIGVDADMKGLKDRKVIERPRGPVVRRDLTGLERTDLCARLAAAHWRAAGAAPVTVMRPPAGADFNDLDSAQVAEGGSTTEAALPGWEDAA